MSALYSPTVLKNGQSNFILSLIKKYEGQFNNEVNLRLITPFVLGELSCKQRMTTWHPSAEFRFTKD